MGHKVDMVVIFMINLILAFWFQDLFFDIVLMNTLAGFSLTGGLGFYILSISGVFNCFLFLSFVEVLLFGFISFVKRKFSFKKIHLF